MKHFFRVLLLVAVAANLFAFDIPKPFARYKRIQTEHFNFVFKEKHAHIAVGFTNFAEQTHAQISEFLNYEVTDKTTVVFIDGSDDGNGYASTRRQNYLVLYLTTPRGVFYNDLENWLRDVFIHEYTHITHFETVRGINKVLARVGPGYHPLSVAPYWYIEGIAMYAETEYTARGRMNDVYISQLIALSALNGEFATYAQASSGTIEFPYGATRYYYGVRFVKFLEEQYGKGSIRALHTSFSKRLPMVPPFFMYTGFRKSFKENFFDSPDNLWARFKEAALYRGAKIKMRFEGEHYTKPQQLSGYAGYIYDMSAFAKSPHILYSGADAHEGGYLKIVDVESGKTEELLTQKSVHAPVVISETEIAYLRYNIRRNYENYLQLFYYDLSSKEETRAPLSNGTRIQHLAYHKEKKRFAGLYDNGINAELFLFTKEGEITKRLRLPVSWEAYQGLEFAGDELVCGVRDTEGNNVIAFINPEDAHVRTLHILGGKVYYPHYDEARELLIFSTDAEGVVTLYALRKDGDTVYRLIHNETINISPTTRGDTMYYVSIDGRGSRLMGYATNKTHFAETMISFTWKTITLEAEENETHTFNTESMKNYHGIFRAWWVPEFDLSKISLAIPALPFGATVYMQDTLQRHFFRFNITFDPLNLLPAGGLTYQNHRTPLLFRTSVNTGTYYIGGFFQGIPNKRDYVATNEYVQSLPDNYYYNRYYHAMQDIIFPFFIGDGTRQTLRLSVISEYHTPKQLLDHYYLSTTNLSVYWQIRDWRNQVYLNTEIDMRRQTMKSPTYNRGFYAMLGVGYFPKIWANDFSYAYLDTSFEAYVNPVWHFILYFRGSLSLSSATELLGAGPTQIDQEDWYDGIRFPHNNGAFNFFSSTFGGSVPVWFAYQKIIMSTLFLEKLYLDFGYTVSDVVYGELKELAQVGHYWYSDLHIDFSAYYGRLPMSAVIGVGVNINSMVDNPRVPAYYVHPRIMFLFRGF